MEIPMSPYRRILISRGNETIPFEADSQDRFIPGGEMDPRVKPHRRQVRCRCAMARRFRGGSRSRWRSKAREVDRVGPCRTATEMLVMAMAARRSEEHTSELQSLMRSSYAVFCLKKKKSK